MKLLFIWPGKTRNGHLKALIEDYFGRISRYLKTEIIETSEGTFKNRASDEKKMLARIPLSSYIILLDIHGELLSSEGFAVRLEKLLVAGKDCIVFLVGGENGVSGRLQDISDMLLSLTPMTVTHEMARVILLEQIYRALAIIKNHPYHK